MTLDELHLALVNWGNWSREKVAPDGCAISPVFEQWLCSQWWKDSGEDAPEGVDECEASPNELMALMLEAVIVQMQARHIRWLTWRYVQGQWVDELTMLGPAKRALLDRMGGFVANPPQDRKENKSNAGLPEPDVVS